VLVISEDFVRRTIVEYCHGINALKNHLYLASYGATVKVSHQSLPSRFQHRSHHGYFTLTCPDFEMLAMKGGSNLRATLTISARQQPVFPPSLRQNNFLTKNKIRALDIAALPSFPID
jgi:hypothetical protein